LKRAAGYTLVEMMIGVALVAIMLAVTLPAYTVYQDRVNSSDAVGDMVQISLDLERYFANYGEYPPDLATLGPLRTDPWGNPYQYLNMALTSGNADKRKDRNLVPINTDYDLYSRGPDGKSTAALTAKASRDDIIRANNGQYIGLAADY
jgi:general secretion pathway protein G